MAPISEPAQVLYVDDEASYAEMLSAVLEQQNDDIAVRTAADAERALEVIRKEDVDCVISDYSMPQRNGLEFLRSVREEYEELPFLLLTGKGSEDIASEAISEGVTDYLQKQQGTDHYRLLANRITNAVEQYRAAQELERQTHELEQLKNRFQSFVKQSPDVITAMDGDGTIQYLSPSVERVLGYEQDELIGSNAFEFVHPDDRDEITDMWERFTGTQEEQMIAQEYQFYHADGSWVWIESIMSTDHKSQDSDYIINSRDVTERKQRERELQQKTDRLEEFASIVSHDLQTPITVADARLEMAVDECESEHLTAIGDALDRMDEIIEATLTLARAGQIVDDTEPVDLANLAKGCFQTVAPVEASLQISTESTVEADPERLRHVLENLFANAVDHAGSDVSVSLGDLEDGFYIEDDGPGIPADEREVVFEPGYSMSESGTGFGLSIVEQIVEAHDWEIDATESSMDGARFEITGVETD